MPSECHPDAFHTLSQTLKARKSTRGFLPQPIDQERLEQLFAAAQHSPSWCNIQPWRAIVTMPPLTGRVTQALVRAAQAGKGCPEIPYPAEYPEPYLSHRRACGHTLYAAMNIDRSDQEKRREAWLRNYKAFDAPHLAVITQDKRLGQYGTLDIGIWLGNVLSLAASLAIDTCPMASIASYPQPLRSMLPIASDHVILVGLALGRADSTHPANGCRTTRQEMTENIRFAY